MMNKLISLILLTICLCPFVNSSGCYYNEKEEINEYYTIGKFQIDYIHADRGMGTLDKEDHLWMKYRFTQQATDVKIKIESLDGTSTKDTDIYNFKFDTRTRLKEYELYCGNLPTYVDNYKVVVSYKVNNVPYNHTVYFYCITGKDKGDGLFFINSTGIPTDYKDTDTPGWGEDTLKTVTDPITDVLEKIKGLENILSGIVKMITLPFTIIKELASGSGDWYQRWISFTIGTFFLFLGVALFIKLPGMEFPAIIIMAIGVILTMGVILDSFNAIKVF